MMCELVSNDTIAMIIKLTADKGDDTDLTLTWTGEEDSVFVKGYLAELIQLSSRSSTLVDCIKK